MTDNNSILHYMLIPLSQEALEIDMKQKPLLLLIRFYSVTARNSTYISTSAKTEFLTKQRSWPNDFFQIR